MSRAVVWDDEIDAVLGGELFATLGHRTPDGGAALFPVAPLGLRDRAAATITLTIALGQPAPLLALRDDPAVALAYRVPGRLPHLVLVQGRAAIERADRAWLESITPSWERTFGPRASGLTGRLLRPFYWDRAAVTVVVERIVVLAGAATVTGAPLPAEPPAPQQPPADRPPRIDAESLAGHVGRLPHTELGWVGADGLPVLVPVDAAGGDRRGLELATPARAMLPPGGRRAALLSHSFRPQLLGQEQHRGTGWLEVGGGAVRYAPRTTTGFALPPSRAVFVLGAALMARAGLRRARALGLAGNRR